MSVQHRQDGGAAVRAAAARVLDAVLHGGRSLKAELATVLPTIADPRDRALLEAIVFAALRMHARYAAALAQWMPKPPGRRDGALRALLYVGFAQLDALQLPAHAALASTVDAARVIGRAHQAGLVNALLRRAQRDGLPDADASAAWPRWLLDRLQRDRPGQVEAIVRASAEAGPLWLRVNRRLATPEGVLARLALDDGNVRLRAADAADVSTWWDGTPFDAILLDAPCSATGVVRRQPDILLHRRASDIDDLVALQARLLDAVWPTLAPGGTLLYATCSILRRENDAQVAAFLARTPDARLQPLDARFGEDTGHGSQRLPGQDGMDGFFYARIRK